MLTYLICMKRREKACECREKYQCTTEMTVYLSSVLLNRTSQLKEIEYWLIFQHLDQMMVVLLKITKILLAIK
jgi:hypothetical protein